MEREADSSRASAGASTKEASMQGCTGSKDMEQGEKEEMECWEEGDKMNGKEMQTKELEAECWKQDS